MAYNYSMNTLLAVVAFALLGSPTVLYTQSLSPIVTLPATYFVGVVDLTVTDAGLYRVVYDDIDGYVYASAVEIVDYTPVTKYEKTVTFTANNDNQPVNLRSAPDHRSSNIIATIAADGSGRCYGNIEGSSLIEQVGSNWYYISYNGQKGYVYSSQVTVLPTPENVIAAEPVDAPETPIDNEQPNTAAEVLSDGATIALLIGLSVGAGLIMFLLFKKPRDIKKRD